MILMFDLCLQAIVLHDCFETHTGYGINVYVEEVSSRPVITQSIITRYKIQYKKL